MKPVIGLIFLTLALHAQQQYNSDIVNHGKVDSSGATHTLPAKVGTIAAKPATCTVGEVYFATDATAGQNWYFCTATNTWTGQAAGGSGVGTAFVASLGSAGITCSPSYPCSQYVGIVGQATQASGFANRSLVVPMACTAKNLYVELGTAQGAGGTLDLTLMKNVAGTPTAQALTISMAAGATAGVYSDTTHTVSLSAGDVIALRFTNNHTSTSGAIRGFSFQCQ